MEQTAGDNTSFSKLKWLGVSSGGQEYVFNGKQLEGARDNCGPWRHATNGNPLAMRDVVQTLLPDCHAAFVVERDLNRNVAVYAVNEVEGGEVEATHPMSTFWLMIPAAVSTEDLGEVYTEDLTKVEQTLAYGVSQHRIDPDGTLTVNVRALNGEPITVYRDATDASWRARVNVQGGTLNVHKFMIFTEPRRWAPWPKTVELHVHGTTQGGTPITYHFEVP
jgi:hypothetical protein